MIPPAGMGYIGIQREIKYLRINADHLEDLFAVRTGDEFPTLVSAVKVNDLMT